MLIQLCSSYKDRHISHGIFKLSNSSASGRVLKASVVHGRTFSLSVPKLITTPASTPFVEWENWNQTMKDGFREFMLASMDAIDNWYFWTWKIGNSSAGTVQAPLWSYQLGLEQG